MSREVRYSIHSLSLHHLKKFLGYLKRAMGIVEFSQTKEDHVKKGESYRCLEAFSDSDWSGNKSHRKPTSGEFHAWNSCPLFNSSRAQKIISLSSCEAELRAIVSSASDGITFAQFLSVTSLQVLQARDIWMEGCYGFGTSTDR